MKLSVVLLGALLALPALAQAEMKLTSPAFAEGDTLPRQMEFNGFGCTGGNLSPALNWSGVPEGTKALALTMYDPDAPTGSGWWHWVVTNLPVEATGLPEGVKNLPAGTIESRTDYGVPGYGGMCPPVGDKPHRYIFTLYALKAPLTLDASASGALAGFQINANMIEKATLTGLFGR